MRKYTNLTSTADLNVGDIIYTDTHGGKTPCRVVEIRHDINAVFAPYQVVWDKYKYRSEFDVCNPVNFYYVKSTQR
jgi:hypothetical protein